MLDLAVKNHDLEKCSHKKVVNYIKSTAGRGDFFSVYNYSINYFHHLNNEEQDEIRKIGEQGIETCLEIAAFEAERGIISSMNNYLELASNYSTFLKINIDEKIESIKTIGEKNKKTYIQKPLPNRKHMIRIAGYADL